MRWFFVSSKPISIGDLGSKIFLSRSTNSRGTARFELFSVVGENAYIFSAYSPITLIFFQRCLRLRLYSFRVFGDKFIGSWGKSCFLKRFLLIRTNYFSVLSEYAERLYPYSPNTLIFFPRHLRIRQKFFWRIVEMCIKSFVRFYATLLLINTSGRRIVFARAL